MGSRIGRGREGDVSLTTRPRTRTDLTLVEIDGEAIVYDAETRQLHRLNSTGRIIFSLCDGSATVPQLAADVADLYGLPCEDIETHIDSLLAGLGAAGLLEDTRPGVEVPVASLLEQGVPPAVEPPARHLHTKRRGNP